MKYSEIIMESNKDLHITSMKQFETMISYGSVNLPSGGILVIDIDKPYEITFPPEFVINGNLHVEGQIIVINGDLRVNGNLYIDKWVEILPKKLRVYGDLDLSYTKISDIPKNLIVHGSLDLSYTEVIVSLSKGLRITKNLNLYRSSVEHLASDLIVGQDLIVTNTRIYRVPNTVRVGGEIIR